MREHLAILHSFDGAALRRCAVCDALAGGFAYGAKQKDFAYLCKTEWYKKPAYLQKEHVLEMVDAYRRLVIDYIEDWLCRLNLNLSRTRTLKNLRRVHT